MSKSLTARRNARKLKGSRVGRSSGRDRSPAPHHLPGPKEKGVASMLVRNRVNELLRIEIEDWHRVDVEQPGDESREVCRATAVFRDGQEITRQVEYTYSKGVRERILEAEMNPDPEVRIKVFKEVDAIRKARWSRKAEMLREMQRAYGKGLPA